jgi:DNA modification methylase
MTNKLFYGDNLEVLRKYIKDDTIDLCYIDPPFNSKRNYNQIYNNIGSEDKAQAQAFIDTWTWDEEANIGLKEIKENTTGLYSWQSIELIIGLERVLRHGSLLSYLIHMTRRIAEIYRVLKDSGSFYLHCDPTSSHYLKLVLDAIFCSNKGEFQNEIIWSYKRYTAASNRFQRLHDVIFFYVKTGQSTFNDIREEYGDKSGKADSHYKQDDDGLWYRWQKRKGEEPYKVYLSEGRRIGDVWEIPIINASAKERLGYPTQKPESLLERIINTSTNKGDTILDAYCGCGTSVSVAQRLDRKWIGIDITYQSISLILKRMEDTFGKAILNTIQLNGVPHDMEAAIALANKTDDKTRKEFEKWVVLTFSNNRAVINDKKGGDGGIDGRAFMIDIDSKGETETKRVLFSVKSDKKYPPSYVRDLNGTIEREGAVIGYLLTLYKADNLVKESKQYGYYKNTLLGREFPKIQVICVEDIFNNERMSIPTTQEVVKIAEQKTTTQIGLF